MNDSSTLIFLKNIWPKIYRIINNIFFFLLRVLKGTVKIAKDQIKQN